ncbi:hypothetical protein F4677DRAFT_250422 [Hypoxylon crocopeplum]|nr:hypothetical protein F4677DRAFT_250422 [Hypoxylon crocopeplum]
MPGFFIPARTSRHRTACFALYRALLQQAKQIRLPDDLATAWGPVNPVKHLVRKAFRLNRADVSPRLIFPALKAGYRILALLRSAASSPSDATENGQNVDQASIEAFLRARLAERNRTLAAKELHPPHSRNPSKPSSAPLPETVPLLVNVTPEPTEWNPNPKPVYAIPSRPRPLSELGGSGRRHVPRLDMASDLPILRIKKPQPPLLSRVLTQKIRRRVTRMGAVSVMYEELMPDAELEDEWEQTMATLLGSTAAARARENRGAGAEGKSSDGSTETDASLEGREARAIRDDFSQGFTFRQTVFIHGAIYIQEVLTLERDHLIARADAMRTLIEQEAELAEQEKAQRAVDRRKRWEAKMLELHGEGWRALFPNLDDNVDSKVASR